MNRSHQSPGLIAKCFYLFVLFSLKLSLLNLLQVSRRQFPLQCIGHCFPNFLTMTLNTVFLSVLQHMVVIHNINNNKNLQFIQFSTLKKN